MTRIGIRELKSKTSKIVREVRVQHAEYVITHQGSPVAVLHPYGAADAEKERRDEMEASLTAMQQTARKVAKAWVSSKSAVELLDEQRR
ncbi:MAG TPA: type II toxin-antitoxin system Phd/YefM family antitoxin [Thermoanaerobaculia bacterium]|jgi:prevent-host-death family protein